MKKEPSLSWEAMKKRRADDRAFRAMLSNKGTLPDYAAWTLQRAQFYAYANRCAFARGERL